jgi:WD40 repeat protein
MGGKASVELWDVVSRQTKARFALPDPEQLVRRLRLSPDGTRLATLEWQSSAYSSERPSRLFSMQIWDVATGKPMEIFGKNPCLAISRDWKIALSLDGLIDLAHPDQQRPAHKNIPTNAIQSARLAEFSPDGRLVALTFGDSTGGDTVRLWDVSTGQPRGHTMQVRRQSGVWELAFSPDNLVLVTSELSGGIQLWDTSTGLPCGPPLPTTRALEGLLFSPDSRCFCVSWIQRTGRTYFRRAECWPVPATDLSLAELERRTWLRAGTRLDPAGSLEAIPPDELRLLEAGQLQE